MKGQLVRCVVVIAAATLAACADLPSSVSRASSASDLAVAYSSVPVGYSLTQSTYASDAEGTGPFFPADHGMGGLGRGPGPAMGGGMGPMIGGGLGPDFIGGPGLGHGFGHGHFGDPALDGSNCSFNSASGRVECAAVTDPRGLTIVRSVSYTNASGQAQSAFDTVTTNAVNTRVQVSGTVTRRDSAVSVMANSSDRTITGLAQGSTQHTINGVAAGSETTTGRDSAGTFIAYRTAADTIRGVIVPVSDTGRTFPTAGTIIRVMQVSSTHGDGTSQSSSRREVITYDGSATARMVITQGGTTRTCTLPLPFGRPPCD
jgi:hypothetical protein